MSNYGLVLSGGGAKGSYEIGVWKALKDIGVPISAITGTSIGALNGAMLVQDDYELASLAWTNFSAKQIIDIEENTLKKEKIYSKHFSFFSILKNIFTPNGMELYPLKNVLEEYIDEDQIRNSPIDFGLVTFSLTDLKPLQIFKDEIPKGQFVDYLVASACFPAFKPIEINNKKYIDGGFYDNVPISLMSNCGVKNIIVVDISGFVPKSKPNTSLNITYIQNSHDLGGTLEINPKKAKENIKLGYLDTMKTFDIVSGKTYYLVQNLSKKEKTLEVGNLSRKNIREMLGITKSTPKPIKKLITRKFFKTLDKYIDIEVKTNTAICIAMAEVLSKILDIDPTKVYTLNDLNNIILKLCDKTKSSHEFKSFANAIRKLNHENKTNIINREMHSILKDNEKLLTIYLSTMSTKDKDINSIRRYIAFSNPKITLASLYLRLLNKQTKKQEKTYLKDADYASSF